MVFFILYTFRSLLAAAKTLQYPTDPDFQPKAFDAALIAEPLFF